jgi:hypothetical protein
VALMADRSDRPEDLGIQLTVEEQKRRRSRSLALGLVLVGLVLLFYVVTIAKLGPGVVTARPL